MDASVQNTGQNNLVSVSSPPSTPSLQNEKQLDLVPTLVGLMALKDRSTLRHSQRVHELTREWSEHLQSRGKPLHCDSDFLETAALLHDVGKLGVLDEVLGKKGALTEAEWGQIQLHSEIGYQMIRDYPRISEIALGVRHHHERWDGKGYPMGLSGKQIPEIAQVIAIVDAYDAMTSDRPYRKAMGHGETLQEILKEAGRHFNPDLARNFVEFMHARNT